MFSNLRNSSQIYILHKDATPYIEVATVTGVTIPKPKFPMPPQFGQPQEMVVDVTAKIGEQQVTYQALPANLDVADSAGDNIVVTTSRDAMNAEVSAMKQRSIDIINSADYHRGIIQGCDKILQAINPEFAEKQAQQAEINALKTQMGEMNKSIAELLSAIRGTKTSSASSSTQ